MLAATCNGPALIAASIAMTACGRHSPPDRNRSVRDEHEAVGYRDASILLPTEDKRTWEHPSVPSVSDNHLPDFGRDPLPCESYDPAKSRDSEGIRQMRSRPCQDQLVEDRDRSPLHSALVR